MPAPRTYISAKFSTDLTGSRGASTLPHAGAHISLAVASFAAPWLYGTTFDQQDIIELMRLKIGGAQCSQTSFQSLCTGT